MPNLKGYPQPVGTKREAVHDHTGPASYTQLAGGGDPLTNQNFGLGWLEYVGCGVDNTGTYMVVAVKSPGPQQTIKLMWLTLIGMTEVAGATNLSASTVTLWAKGF